MSPETAQDIADKRVPDPEWVPRRWLTVPCNVRRANIHYRNWAKYYQPYGEEHVAGKRARFEKFVETGAGIHCPVVRLCRRPNDPSMCELRFLDGMHRFCVLRDAGATTMPMMMTRGHARLAHEIGLAQETP